MKTSCWFHPGFVEAKRGERLPPLLPLLPFPVHSGCIRYNIAVEGATHNSGKGGGIGNSDPVLLFFPGSLIEHGNRFG